jgi:hypothetical protein
LRYLLIIPSLFGEGISSKTSNTLVREPDLQKLLIDVKEAKISDSNVELRFILNRFLENKHEG